MNRSGAILVADSVYLVADATRGRPAGLVVVGAFAWNLALWSYPAFCTAEGVCFAGIVYGPTLYEKDRFRQTTVPPDDVDMVDSSALFRTATRPVTGFSGLRRLARDFQHAEHFTRWATDVEGAGLKVNPTYLFGGDHHLWGALYPENYAIRVNYSVSSERLAVDLDLLSEAVPA